MKKLLLLSSIIIVGCSTPEQPKAQIVKDCNYNRVVDVRTSDVMDVGYQPGLTRFYSYTTVNDCTGTQKDSEWSTNYVAKGDCK